jgi:hypothetical protein
MNAHLLIPGVLPLAVALWFWARWLVRRFPQARQAATLQLVAIAVPIATMGSSAYLIRQAFSSQTTSSAAQRATEIARAVTWSMWITEAGIGLLLLALLLLAIYHSRLSDDTWRGPPLPGQGDDDEPDGQS